MRTTVTLDPDNDFLVRRLMRERSLSFKAALNEAIRNGQRPHAGAPTEFRTRTVAMGPPRLALDRALTLAGDLEDVELARRLTGGR